MIPFIWKAQHRQTRWDRFPHSSVGKQEWVSAKSPQSSLTLCNPRDCSASGSSVHGILQSRTLEWVSSSRGSFWLRDGACVSCVVCIGSEFFTTSATWWLILSDENLYVVQCRGHGFKSWVRKIPWRRKWLPTPVSCLGNTMDRGTWRATVHGVLRVRHDFHHRHIETESSMLVYRDGRRVRKWRFDLGRVFLEAGENISELSKRTSLVGRWIRIRLPMQGTWVWSLVQEDPTCWGAAEPVHRNFWGWALEPALCNKRSHHKEKPKHCNQREASTCPN